MFLASVVAAALSVVAPSLASAATYYVRVTGSDAANGTSPTSAWATVSKVNNSSLAPGNTVLFEGGSTFGGLLRPTASGNASAPITFASFGTGRANLRDGIALASESWLVLDDLAVDPGSWQGSTVHGIASSSSGTGVKNVVVRNCSFANVLQGLLLSNHADQDWTVSGNTIRYARDSGIIISDPAQPTGLGGNHMLFEGNTVLDVGLDSTLTYSKHGIYSKGTDVTLRNNTVRRWNGDPAQPSAGLTLRGHNSIAEGNVLSDGQYGITWIANDSVPGTTRIAYNRISNVSAAGIVLDRVSGPVPSVESFVVADNTVVGNSLVSNAARGIVVGGTTGSVKVANNIVSGTLDYSLKVDSVPTGGFSERNDLWANARLAFTGVEYRTLAGYTSATGQGTGDRAGDPLLDTTLTPLAGSPAVDGGTTTVDAALTYLGDCSSALYHYCGAAPDMGAGETAGGSGAPPPPPPPPTPYPADTTAPTVVLTGPQDGSTTARSVTVTANATDDRGVASVSFWVDGKQKCLLTAGPYSCRVSLSTGRHTLTAKATDAAGNVGSASVHVTAQRNVLSAGSFHARHAGAKHFTRVKRTHLRKIVRRTRFHFRHVRIR